MNFLNNFSRQREILKFAKTYGGQEGKIATKEYKRFNIITLLIVFLVVIPLICYTVFSINDSINPKYPPGATQEKLGHVSLYSDNFWYTSDDQVHKFDFSDLNIKNDFEPGSKILIYLDSSDNLVSVAHEDNGAQIAIKILLMLIIPIVILSFHSFIGRKIYAKNYVNFCKWYEIAIEPHKYTANYQEVLKTAKYQDISNIEDVFEEDTLKTYKKYKRINAILTALFFILFVFIVYIYIKLEINVYSVFSIIFIIIYVVSFMIPISIMDSKIKKIKKEHLDKIKK